MELTAVPSFIYLVPPTAGAIIGYFTNDLAIRMLFRPYRARYIGRRRLPFTPGLIPRNQERLAQNVASTITQSLLTPEELEHLARRLLARENLEAAIRWLVNLALAQIRSEKQPKTAKLLSGILKDLISQSLPRLIRVLARREDFLEDQLNQIFDRVILKFRLTEVQARQMADWILQVGLPPDVIRQTLVNFLSDRNIQIIDDGFREKTSGTYWVVANVFGLRNALARLREYLLDEKERANAQVQELILTLSVRDRIRRWLQSLSLENFPSSTVRQLRQTVGDTVRDYLQADGVETLQNLGDTIDWDNLSELIISRLQSSELVSSSIDTVAMELTDVLERYLEEDLEKLVERALPILAIDQVIIEKIKATSPAQLEAATNGIVKNELQAIVNLGGILGFVVGLMQTGFLIFF
ncbi:MAG: DUF445 family protein [Cyanobacteria bacterium P01_H01_bin.15]